MEYSIFNKITNTLFSKGKSILDNSQEDLSSRSFFLRDFIQTLTYYYVRKIDSLRVLVTQLKYNNLGLKSVPYSTLRDCFERFSFKTFESLYYKLVSSLEFMTIPELSLLGRIYLVDGSIFKLSLRADWAEYRSSKKGFKLHFFWDLNQMTAAALSIKKAVDSEIDELITQLVAGVTYICDRGYVSFKLFETIVDNGSHFVIRLRKNMCWTILEEYTVDKGYISLKDSKIRFKNDLQGREYRLICFKVPGQKFYLVTDRFDLDAKQIILLYALRWQIELMFRFFKRTMNGLHILNETKNGLLIQLYMNQIVYLLLLNLKQTARKALGLKTEKINLGDMLNNPVSYFGKMIKENWKLSKHWFIKLKSLLDKEFNEKNMTELAL